MSGAGSIKWDASDEDTLYEMKDANDSHTIKGTYLLNLFRDAIKQGKEARYVIYFTKADITVDCRIRRGKQ